MALLCFAIDKPEPEWFDAKYLEQVQETVSKTKQLYHEYNLDEESARRNLQRWLL